MKEAVKTKPYGYPEGNELKVLTGKIKGKASKPKRYRCKNTQTKTQSAELEADTDFKGQCSDIERYILNIGLRYLENFSRTM